MKTQITTNLKGCDQAQERGTKMTRRERLEAVINGNITEELVEECKAELEKMNASNAARSAKPTARQIENAKVAEDILGFLTSEPMFVDSIVTNLGGDFTRQRVSGILTNLVKEGKVVSEDVKVKGKGKRKAYTLA